jgi:hypothetical protein
MFEMEFGNIAKVLDRSESATLPVFGLSYRQWLHEVVGGALSAPPT